MRMSGLPGNPIANPDAVITGDKYRLTVLTPGLIRLEFSPDGSFEDRASTFAVNRKLPKPECRFKKTDEGGVELVTQRMRVSYDGKALSPSGLHVVLIKKKDFGVSPSEWRYGQADRENLGGTARTLDEVNGRCDLGQGIISKNGISVIDDSNSMLFTSDGFVAARKQDAGRSDIYVFGYGSDHREALQAFHAVSGKAPVIPRWAFGNWWSRFHAYTDTEYIELMDRFKAEGIPLTVGVIDMDWHIVDDVPPEEGAGWTGYTWNKKLFPDHVKFLKELHDRDLKVTLNTHPADGIRSFEDCYERMCKALGRDPKDKEPVVFDPTDREFLNAYFKAVHHPLEDEGVDFWWMDWQQGQISKTPGIDPLWVLNHFHFLDSQRRLGRRMTFSRFAGPGSQRYPIGFSGDTIITWDSLHFQPEFTATASNIGFGWWSNDIGGHMHGEKDDELLARWTQLGLWSPFLRLHSTNNPFLSRAPWLRPPECRGIMTEALQYRHRLIPYLYTMSVRATQTDQSLVEPMYYDHPTATEAYRNKNQYLFGSELLVSPITTKKVHSTDMASTPTWLPAGRHVDIFTGLVYDGDRIINMHRPTDKTPVFAREGSILPLDASSVEGQVVNGAPIPTALEIMVVVGKDGRFELFEDDGKAEDIESIKFTKTLISFDQASGQVTIHPTENPLVKERGWSIQLPAFDVGSKGIQGISAKVGGKTVDLETSHHTSTGAIVVSLRSPTKATDQITFSLGAEPKLKKNDTQPRALAVLDRAQMDHDLKWGVWDLFQTKGLTSHVFLSRLRAFDLDEHVLDALLEIVLAQN